VKKRGLIRSGWWVLVAAVVVCALVLLAMLRLPTDRRSRPATEPFAVEPCRVEPDTLVRAMAPDTLKALTLPAMMTRDEVSAANENERGKLLVSSDRVVGVQVDGVARAYPLRLLRWHEVVNDVIGDRAIAVTYSPLSGAIAVWDRSVDGRELELAVSGRLYQSNTLLYDRPSAGARGSLWHQLTGEALTGPSLGRRLRPLPASLQTWADWTREHPEASVMAPDAASKPLYKRDPYHSYRGSDVLRFPVDPLPPEGALRLKDPVAIVTVDGADAVFALRDLEQAVGTPRGQWAALLGDELFIITFDAAAGTVAVAPNDPGITPPPVRFAYWFEWFALHPDAVPLP
jgi:hypothetical protein